MKEFTIGTVLVELYSWPERVEKEFPVILREDGVLICDGSKVRPTAHDFTIKGQMTTGAEYVQAWLEKAERTLEEKSAAALYLNPTQQ